MGKKESTTVYIEPRQLKALRFLKERTGIPMAELIRQGIDAVLAREELKNFQYDIHVDRTGLAPGHELELECGPPTPIPLPKNPTFPFRKEEADDCRRTLREAEDGRSETGSSDGKGRRGQ